MRCEWICYLATIIMLKTQTFGLVIPKTKQHFKCECSNFMMHFPKTKQHFRDTSPHTALASRSPPPHLLRLLLPPSLPLSPFFDLHGAGVEGGSGGFWQAAPSLLPCLPPPPSVTSMPPEMRATT